MVMYITFGANSGRELGAEVEDASPVLSFEVFFSAEDSASVSSSSIPATPMRGSRASVKSAGRTGSSASSPDTPAASLPVSIVTRSVTEASEETLNCTLCAAISVRSALVKYMVTYWSMYFTTSLMEPLLRSGYFSAMSSAYLSRLWPKYRASPMALLL